MFFFAVKSCFIYTYYNSRKINYKISLEIEADHRFSSATFFVYNNLGT